MKGISCDLAVIVNSNSYGGTERHTLDFISRINDKSLSTVFFYSGPGFVGHIPGSHTFIRTLKIESKVQNVTLTDIKIWRDNFKEYNATTAILIKPSYFSIDLKFLLLTRLYYKNLIVIEHSLPPKRLPIKRIGFIPKIGFWRLKNEILRYLFAKLIKKVIAVSELSKVELEKHTFYKNIRVCGNGIDLDYWIRDHDKGKEFRAQYGIDPDLHLFGCVGNLFPVKSFHIAIKALSLVSKEFRDRCGLCIVGVGPEEKKLKELANKLNVDNVFFVGKQIDMVAVYSAMQTLLITSISESVSLVLLEATVCDCNIISSNVGICADVIKEMNNGTIIKSHDPEAWAKAIEVDLKKDRLTSDVKKNSLKKKFKKKYDTKVAMDRLLKALISDNK